MEFRRAMSSEPVWKPSQSGNTEPMGQRLFSWFVLAILFCFGAAILYSPGCGSRGNARRSSCQSNLKQISLAVAQYASDYDDLLPQRYWSASLLPYTKSEQLFWCPETNATQGTSDYFWNARLNGTNKNLIAQPATLVLLGDGRDDAPLDATLNSFPNAWRRDENSPAWRHLDTANYAFADGHVKSLKANRVTRDLRMGVAK